jgi:glycosyltransferase involved in cell wall biosynthesis
MALSSLHLIFLSGACNVRIVYVLTSLGMGGAERQVLALGRRMAQGGHTVAIVVLRPRLAEEWPTPLDVIHLDMRKTPLSVLAAMARGRRFLRAFCPDIVHSHGFHGNIVARAIRLIARSPAPISTIHNVYEGGRLRMLAYRMTDRLSALTTAVSAAAAERFIRLKAVRAGKCIVVPNGIDCYEFSPSRDRREQMRREMWVDAEFVWLAAGRMVPAKDYPNLLRAFARVRTELPAARLWIAGEAADSAEAERLRTLIPELQIEDRTKCLGLRRDMPALLDAADGFVLSSAWEGMPLVIGEAMAMEKPVVATDAGGTRELLGDGGVLVPARDSEALARAMLHVMRWPANQRQSTGHAARNRVEQNFSIDAKAVEWEKLYSDVQARRRAVRPRSLH